MSRTNAYYIVRAALAVALPAATASTAVPLAMSSGLSANMDSAPHLPRASLAGIWSSVANGDRVHALLREGDVVWSATEGGGVVRWNVDSGAYRQYLSPQHGLPDNDVRALVRDREGVLWAATANRLARLDGTTDRWLAIPADHPEIQSWSTTALAVAPDGTLQVGFEQRWDPSANGPSGDTPGAFVGGGLARYDPRTGAWGPFYRAEQTDRRGERFATIPSDNVTAIASSGDGLVWIGTRPYFVWDEDVNGTNSGSSAWVRRGGGLAATDGSQWRQWSSSGVVGACLANHITALAVDVDQRVWAATAGRGLQLFRNGLATEGCSFAGGHSAYLRQRGRDEARGIPANIVWSVAIGDDGRVWTGVGEGYDRGLGVVVLDYKGTLEDPSRPWESDDVWTTLGLDGRIGTLEAVVSALVVSGDGVFAGTKEAGNLGDGLGIKRLTPNGAWRTYATAESGLPSNRITALAVHPSTGDQWFGTASRGIARWDGERWLHWPAFGRKEQVATLATAAPEGTTHVTLSIDSKAFADAFPGPLRLVRFGSDPSLYRIVSSQTSADGARLQITPRLSAGLPVGTAAHTIEPGPPSDVVTAIDFDPDGRTWVGGRETIWLGNDCSTYPNCWLDGGLAVFDEHGWTTVDKSGLPSAHVQAVEADADGRIWVGTDNATSVYELATDTWTPHGVDVGLGPGGAADFAVDPDTGHTWAANHATSVCVPDESGSCIPKQLGGGVSRWDGASWTSWSKTRGAPLLAFGDEGDFTSILVDAERDLVWAGAWADDPGGFHWHSGVGIRTVLNWCPRDCQSGRWESRAFENDGPVTALKTDEAGRLWVGASRGRTGIIPPYAGLRVLSGEAWSTLSRGGSRTAPTLPDDRVTALYPYGAAMWIGTFDRGAAIWRQMTPVDFAFLPVARR